MIKKIMMAAGLCFLVFWCGRIYSVNMSQAKQDVCYTQTDIANYQGMKIKLSEAHIYDIDEFQEKYNVTIDYMGSGNKVICACFEVTNPSYSDMSWDDVMELTMCGFQTDTWASSVSPIISEQINVFGADCLKAGATQKIWYATTMMRESFKESTWEQMEHKDFYYVFSLSPQKTMIKLDI